jgi:uncharacterized protein (DUF1330 family)
MHIPFRLQLLAPALAAGLLALNGAHAQEAPAAQPRAFYISEFVVTDREGMKPYSAQVESTFRPYGGRYIVRGGKVSTLEGEGPQGDMVVIEFDNVERAQAWYHSPAYRKLMPIRHRNATSRVYIVEGSVAPPAP